MSRYAVDPLELARADTSLAAEVAHARVELAGLRSHMRSLLDTGWRGPAATAFEAARADWLRGAEELLAALVEMAEAIGASGRGYALTEDAVRTSMARS